MKNCLWLLAGLALCFGLGVSQVRADDPPAQYSLSLILVQGDLYGVSNHPAAGGVPVTLINNDSGEVQSAWTDIDGDATFAITEGQGYMLEAPSPDNLFDFIFQPVWVQVNGSAGNQTLILCVYPPPPPDPNN